VHPFCLKPFSRKWSQKKELFTNPYKTSAGMQLAEHGANQITTAPQLAVVAGLAVRLASDV